MELHPTDLSYQQLLLEIKNKIRAAQVRAIAAANREMLFLYWDIGKSIIQRQETANWGDKTLHKLASDLKTEFSKLEGFSSTNLKYMRQFAKAYPQFPIGQAPLDQITWYHNITLLQKCPDETKRFWYAAAALENGWSRDVLVHQRTKRT